MFSIVVGPSNFIYNTKLAKLAKLIILTKLIKLALIKFKIPSLEFNLKFKLNLNLKLATKSLL